LSKLTKELSNEELQLVDELTPPAVPVIYEIIAQDGNDELRRPLRSLCWAGIAAGLLISLSVYSEAALRAAIGDKPWRHLVENLGYSVGFVAVVLGRLQLFTENTITTVAPLLISPSGKKLWLTTRLWLIVFLSNMVGTFIAAICLFHFPVATPEISLAISELSHHIFSLTLNEKISRGVLAGIMIATMVWALPGSRNNALWVIILFTYVIALGDLTHVVAGSVEAFYAALEGVVTYRQAVFSYILPTMLGNIIGGTLVFTLLVYAQISPEIEPN
jgi:formate/nitrite transporter FocA (FNT family)